VAGLLARDRRSLDILSVKEEANLSPSEKPGTEKCTGEEDTKICFDTLKTVPVITKII